MKVTAKAFIRQKRYEGHYGKSIEIEMARVTPTGKVGRVMYDFCTKESKRFGLIAPKAKRPDLGGFSYGEWALVTITVERS